MANKRYSKLGFYLLSFDPAHPDRNCEYLIKWPNKLDFGDCDMYEMKEIIENKERFSIVISCKMIGYNTYNIYCIEEAFDEKG